MARAGTIFVCQSCGHRHNKWAGRCDNCQSWNSLTEENTVAASSVSGRPIEFVKLTHHQPNLTRWLTRLPEFDRVCGDGLVPGSAVLIGGDPGIGKSTILLQVLAHLATDYSVAYISGEESIDQIQRRAHRLNLQTAPVNLAAETNVANILASLEKGTSPQVVVIDSIQTLYTDVLDAATGTVSQVRACSQMLIQWAKKSNAVLILVGHVTKEGALAGPKVLEHMVDTVLYFEGERGTTYRLLRAVKNRFGPCNEIGVFEMSDAGLQGVANPSSFFLSDRQTAIDGSSVFVGMEGSRPLLIEIQALVSPCPYGTPRRAVVGWDAARLHMILAVLEARCGLSFSNREVYLNVMGGLKINEPGADLAVAASLLSAISGTPLPFNAVFCGEIGLSGEVRSVNALELRLKEAATLGFDQAYIAPLKAPMRSNLTTTAPDMSFFDVKQIHDLLRLVSMQHMKTLPTQEKHA